MAEINSTLGNIRGKVGNVILYEGRNGKTLARGAWLVRKASEEPQKRQSAVFGNSQTLSTILKYMGKENVPTNLTFKPFGDTDIDSITTAQSTTITIVLAAVPAAVILGTGIVILVKRKNAV